MSNIDSHDPNSNPARDTHDPRALADAARVVDLRLERWYQARRLQLPPEVQAEFTAMAFEAIARDSGRSADAVMDTLIAELDARLGHIVADVDASGADSRRARPSLLQRLRRPFREKDRPRSRPH